MRTRILFPAVLLALAVVLASPVTSSAQLAPDPNAVLVVFGNGQIIPSGDTSPNVTDGTDFGTTIAGEPVSHIFMIQNQGTSSLIIDAISVPAGFSAGQIGGSTPFAGPVTIPPSNVIFLSIQCDASSAATIDDVVSISSNDAGNDRTTFAVLCQVNPAPEIDVAGNANPVADGDSTPSVTDLTDFGSTALNAPVTRSFRISNRGQGDLQVAGVTVPAGFALVASPAAVVPSGGETFFHVRCNATTAGTFSGDVSIANNDSDENPFTFRIRCVAGTADPGFNPGEDNLPPPPPNIPAPVVPATREPSANSGGSSNAGGSSSGGSTAPSTSTPAATATIARTATPTAVPVRSNDGGGQSIFRPPSTGDGVRESGSSGIPAWSVLAVTATLAAAGVALVAARGAASKP